MINGRRVLALITARGGSKGLPGKNVRVLGGKPLIAWSIEAAKASRYVDRIVTSTDDDTIARAASSFGSEVPFKRSAALSSDEASSSDAILDAVERCPGYDYVLLLQPTSPLRTGSDIDSALERCEERHAPACVSVCRVEQSPYWMFTLDTNGLMKPLLPGLLPIRRQDLPSIYVLNGAIYIAKVDWLRAEKTFVGAQTVAYEMPPARSLDIDTELDFRFAESLIQ